MSIVFLFGAGAEVEIIKDKLKFPSGAQFTTETLLAKKSIMMNSLEKFYHEGIADDLSKIYAKDFLFNDNSNTFRRIVEDAITLARKNEDQENKLLKSKLFTIQIRDCKENGSTENKIKDSFTNDFKDEVKKVYDYIVEDADNPEKDKQEKDEDYKMLKKYFRYYGSVEKDFSTIINPQEAGIRRFFRLINYFWSAYFSIMINLCDYVYNEDGSNKKIISKKDKYDYILNNLKDVISTVYSFDWENKIPDNHYYKITKKYFPDSFAITTNYTPFIERIWGKEKCAYLAGSLKLMEDPKNLEIIDYLVSSKKIDENDNRFIFPFMMTQAYIKPIVAPEQIEEFDRAIKALKEADTLVIVGFALNKNDNHIIAIIRKYLASDDNKKMKIFNYINDKDKKSEKDKYELPDCIKPFKSQIKVINFNESNFCEEIKNIGGNEE